MKWLAGRFEYYVTQSWQSRGWLVCLLWPLSQLFAVIAALRRFAYHVGVYKTPLLPVPVIVVGNLTVGGTGKTPLVIALVHQLQQHGWRPGIISRGYGGQVNGIMPVTPDSVAQDVGDEPRLMAQRTQVPVWVGRQRPAVASALLSAHPECNLIISDDGLQHYALSRQYEITVFDARLDGNGWLLPAGPLREPLSRPRDANVLNLAHHHHEAEVRVQQAKQALIPAPYMMTLQLDSAVFLHDGRRLGLSQLRAHKIYACAGIGNPHRFFTMLEQHGLHLSHCQALPDHFDFQYFTLPDDRYDLILITEKDAVKCQAIPMIAQDHRVAYVPLEVQLDPALLASILRKLHGHPSA